MILDYLEMVNIKTVSTIFICLITLLYAVKFDLNKINGKKASSITKKPTDTESNTSKTHQNIKKNFSFSSISTANTESK